MMKKDNSHLHSNTNRDTLLKCKRSDSHLHSNTNRDTLLKCKRSQQEIIGFVLIVLLVVVVAVIFLGIGIRRGGSQVPSDIEINNFLSTSMRYTTECAKDYVPNYQTIEDLMLGCYNNPSSECLDGKKYCNLLNRTYVEMLGIMWPTSEDRPIKYHELVVFYQGDMDDPSTIAPPILEIEQGNDKTCPIKRTGTHLQSYGGGRIVTEFTICEEALE